MAQKRAKRGLNSVKMAIFPKNSKVGLATQYKL